MSGSAKRVPHFKHEWRATENSSYCASYPCVRSRSNEAGAKTTANPISIDVHNGLRGSPKVDWQQAAPVHNTASPDAFGTGALICLLKERATKVSLLLS